MSSVSLVVNIYNLGFQHLSRYVSTSSHSLQFNQQDTSWYIVYIQG